MFYLRPARDKGDRRDRRAGECECRDAKRIDSLISGGCGPGQRCKIKLIVEGPAITAAQANAATDQFVRVGGPILVARPSESNPQRCPMGYESNTV